MDYIEQIQKSYQDALLLASTSAHTKNKILMEIAQSLRNNKQAVLRENKKDISLSQDREAAFVDRLMLTEDRFDQMVQGICEVAKLVDPVGSELEKIEVNGLLLRKVAVPLGLILVIYEARPNVTAEAFSLAFKAGSGVILKGGSAAMNTNKAIANLIKVVLKKYLLEDVIFFVDSVEHADTERLLKLHGLISVVIPRGGKQLVEMVQKESAIPVLSHADGIDHIFVDKSADLKMALKVIIDSKTDRPATCNTVDTVLVHADIAKYFLPKLIKELESRGVKITKEYGREFLSLQIAVKTVKNIDEAITHIHKYGSKHTEGIVAADKNTIEKFVNRVDAAAVMVNCSTRLHDGGVFGMGAEMGIATGKLHARGPVGLKELTAYKWIAYGNGQTRGGYNCLVILNLVQDQIGVDAETSSA